MKVLMLVYRQYPYVSANTAIAYTLAEQLRLAYGWEIVFAGHIQDAVQIPQNGYHGFKVLYLDSLNDKLSYAEKIYDRIACRLNAFLTTERKMAKKLNQLIETEGFDAAIAFCAPDEMVSALYLSKAAFPKVMYQLDPYHTMNGLGEFNRYLKTKRFHKYMKRYDWLFVTRQLENDYLASGRKPSFSQIMSAVEHPKLISGRQPGPHLPLLVSTPDAYNLLYCGTLYLDIRGLAPMQALSGIQSVAVHFVGGIYGGYEPAGLSELKSAGVTCYGRQSPDTARQAMDEADVLLNIGNTVANQLPSKLIDYISTGKPILNIYLRDDCPTLRYMEKYPLGLSVPLAEMSTSEAQQHILAFCEKNAGKKLDYETVKALYPECTVEYVAEKVNEVVGRLVKGQIER